MLQWVGHRLCSYVIRVQIPNQIIREDLMRRLLGETQQVVLAGVQIPTGDSLARGLNLLARNGQISSLNPNMIQSGAVPCSIYTSLTKPMTKSAWLSLCVVHDQARCGLEDNQDWVPVYPWFTSVPRSNGTQ